ncbi:MAG: site-2 protease family protein [Gemmatales bacterium]|nr:site-2 protease family protein [Gemmatales bacterium]MDW7995812.1 site-2 protease family protein [Gemmatales bacterium]
MGWSLRIGRLFGIDVYAHFTFLLFLIWIGVSYYLVYQDWLKAAMGMLMIVMLFTIVVMHELGHALTARRFGIRTRHITLLPIGGVAWLERIPEKPWQELAIAIAGPAVNIVLAGILYAVFTSFLGTPEALLNLSAEITEQVAASTAEQMVRTLFWVNVMLVAFNLLPAFPMDGGRVLRALLAMHMEYAQATNIAASIGQLMAILFGFLGLVFNPMLLFIALFVWIGAQQEAAFAQQKAALWGIPVRDTMITNFTALSPQHTLAEAAHLILQGYQIDFPVVEDGRLVGVLPGKDIIAGLAQLGPQALVREVMRQDCLTANPYEMVETVLLRMDQNHCPVVPVIVNGQIIGVLTRDNIAEYILIRRALEEARRRLQGYL